MSVDAIKWAWTAPVDTSSERLILLSLADRAGEDHTAWPSTERLMMDTKLNLKTVKDVIARLIVKGFLEDTGRRVGKTGRVRVLRLKGVNCRVNPTENGSISKPQNKQSNQPNNGTIESTQFRNDTENGMIPFLPPNEPENGSLNRPENGSQNLSRNLTLEKNKNNVTSFLTASDARALWTPELNILNDVLAEENQTPANQAEIDAVLVKFNRHNAGMGHNDNQLYPFLCTWIINARCKSRNTPVTQKPKYSSEYQEPDYAKRQTESPIPKDTPFAQKQDWESFGCGYTVGNIRKNQQANESPEHCLARLIRETAQAKAGAL